MVSRRGFFEALVILARLEDLAIIPKHAPIIIGLFPKEDLLPNEAIIRTDAGVLIGAITGEAKQLLRT